MKIFNNTEKWGQKVNFVDDNNVMLGYDMDQDCCEHADWFIADSPQEKSQERDENWDIAQVHEYRFDTEYFKEVKNPDDLDEGGMVIFRIYSKDHEKFIHLFNCHNGYYGHGFDFKVGDKTIQEGCL